MSSEVGDVDIVEADAGLAVSGRRHKQQFRLVNGVMTGVRSEFLQATGEQLYTDHVVITESGTWTAPEVDTLKIVLVGRGEDGQPGTDGTWDKDGAPGAAGQGGKINVQTISINPGQTFTINFGTDTTFGAYTSADGQRYNGFADIGSNLAFGLTGTEGNALPSTGNGGGGGAAGLRGIRGYDNHGNYYVRRYPTTGKAGGLGGSGCVVVYFSGGE